MDIERSPVVNDIILGRGHRDDAHFRMLAKKIVTDRRPAARLVKRDDDEIRPGSIHALDNLGLIRDFTDDLDVSLVRKSRENRFAHETRAVCHKDPNNLFHCVLPAATVSWSQSIGVSINFPLWGRAIAGRNQEHRNSGKYQF
jgi:hypothetical protein